MHKFKPGQSIHVALTSTKGGVLTDVSALALTARFPDGSLVPMTPTRDSQGTYHGDVMVPLTAPPGIGVIRAENGPISDPSSNAMREQRFVVEPLDF